MGVSPGFADGHVALGEVYFRQGKLYEAEQEFKSLARAQTEDARAYLGMARVSKANSYYKQAKRMIDKAYELDPDNPDITRERFEFAVSAQVRKPRSDAGRAEQGQAQSNELATEASQKPKAIQVTVKPADRTCQPVSKLTSMPSKLKVLRNLEFKHCAVEVIDKSPIQEADGLIGGDVFEDFLVNWISRAAK